LGSDGFSHDMLLIKPSGKYFSLANLNHAYSVAIRLHTVKHEFAALQIFSQVGVQSLRTAQPSMDAAHHGKWSSQSGSLG
jgi:hypothetical protein